MGPLVDFTSFMIPYFIVCSPKAPFTNCSTIILLLSYPNYLISRSEKGVGGEGGGFLSMNHGLFPGHPLYVIISRQEGRQYVILSISSSIIIKSLWSST